MGTSSVKPRDSPSKSLFPKASISAELRGRVGDREPVGSTNLMYALVRGVGGAEGEREILPLPPPAPGPREDGIVPGVDRADCDWERRRGLDDIRKGEVIPTDIL